MYNGSAVVMERESGEGQPMSRVRETEREQARSADGQGHEPRSTATVTVTIRMTEGMVEALKREAQHQGVRGYQTLMKLWIEERLDGDRLVAASRLTPVLRRLQAAERELHRLLAEEVADH